MNISDSGSWTSLRKSPLLLPWRISHAKDVKILPSFAPVNYTHQSGNPSQRYQLGGARVLSLQTDNSQRDYLPPPETMTFINLCPYGAEQLRVFAGYAANHVRGCLVCLSFSEDGEIFAELPGTMIRSDGIIATSANCLSSLKSKGLKVTVDVRIPDTGETYNAVLLDTGFCSDIGFVKISSCGQQPVPAFGQSDSLYCTPYVVAAGCSSPYGDFVSAKPRYTGCHLGLLANRRTWPIIEAKVLTGKPPEIGGCLISTYSGVVGIIHYVHDFEVKATPIELVLKTLEHIEMHRNNSGLLNSGLNGTI
ncbi:hypothetical protein Vadar_005706 [Vaccinium darrowii]|uniref:Uncharacterized protein n=1 Tax=Vaccinium darrowii TaxID=229202 RepID=A0ACB7XXU9_9ERIC|nr:hypothetical protein Vadar_005706 [Vaccinium darrowii]